MKQKKTDKNTQAKPADELRSQAEVIARENAILSPKHFEELTPNEVRQTLYELRVHQVELEMQNEQLRQAQTELETVRARYFDLYDLAPVGYFTLNEKGLILEANLTAANLLGVARSSLVKQPLTRFILPNDQDIYYGHRKLLFETGAPQICEIRMMKKDGAPFWVRIDAVAAKSNEGASLCRATMIDISERKQGEEALRKSQEQLTDAHRLAHIGVWNWFAKTDTVVWSEELYRIAGLDPLLPAPTYAEHSNIYVPESWNLLKEAVERAMKTGEPYQLELQFARPDGKIRWVNAYGGVTYESHGLIKGLYGTVQDITERKQAEQKIIDTLDRLGKAFGTTVQVLVSVVETRDPYTSGHQMRSADLARAIAVEMGLSQERIDGIRMASSIHDIGKISVPAEILVKPTKLSDLEFSLIKEHARKGFEMLKYVESPWPLAEIVYQHHERMDGSGYPRGLKGEETLIEARILAIADVVESMASHRPYRPSLGLDAALAEIENNKGTLYDSNAVDACLRLFREKGYQLEGIRF